MTQTDSAQPEKTALTGKQKQAALCLARSLTISKTAKEVGVSDITIERWKRKPDFMAAIRQAEDDLYSDQLRALKKTAGAAIACLVRNMDSTVSAYVQVQAATKLIELAIEVHTLQELAQGMEELKQRLDEAGDK